MNNSEIKIEFWKNSWENLIFNFLKTSYGLNLYSPHILIQDIIVEIEENSFRNKENKKYFLRKLGGYLNNDKVIKTYLKSEFELLCKNFEDIDYTLVLCKKINGYFEDGLYFNETLTLVKKVLLEDIEPDEEFIKEINYYSQSLIIELIKKSYVLEDISNFIVNIFDEYKYIERYGFDTKYPHGLDYENFKENGEINYQKVEEKIIYIIDNLNTSDRIQRLSYYYEKEPEEVKYLFYIEGLKGANIEQEICGVTFYSLDKKHFVTNPRGPDKEDLQSFDPEDKYLQVAVDVEFLSPESSLKLAVSKVENALDGLAFCFNLSTPLVFNENNYLIVDKNGRNIASGWSRSNDRLSKYMESLDFNDIDKPFDGRLNKKIISLSNYKDTKALAVIKNALHWYRKAEQATKGEDKVLNYWVALEALFSSKKDKFKVIQKTIVNDQELNFRYDYGWELYDHFRAEQFNLWRLRSGKALPKIPPEIIEQAQLGNTSNPNISLKKFIDALPQLQKYEEDWEIYIKMNAMIKFYSDLKYRNTAMSGYREQVGDDVLMIYRLRNLIVHNAQYDNTLLPYFVWKIRTYLQRILAKFIDLYKDDIELSELLLNINIEQDKKILDFKEDRTELFKANKNELD